jgi:hypothetical protein
MFGKTTFCSWGGGDKVAPRGSGNSNTLWIVASCVTSVRVTLFYFLPILYKKKRLKGWLLRKISEIRIKLDKIIRISYFSKFFFLKGIVQRKLRWVENGVNRSVGASYCSAGHSFVILFRFHLGFPLLPFPVSTAQVIGEFRKNRWGGTSDIAPIVVLYRRHGSY